MWSFRDPSQWEVHHVQRELPGSVREDWERTPGLSCFVFEVTCGRAVIRLPKTQEGAGK